MKLLTLIMAGLLATAAQAQTTWKGLHFGESRDNVRAQLSQLGFATEASQEGSLQSTADYQLDLPNLRNPLPMQASFHFSDAGLLTDVTLTVDVPGMRRYWAAMGSDDVLFNYAADKLAAALSGRYGTPLYRSATCEADAKSNANFCTVSWHGADQSVELERVQTPRGPRLIVRYQPLATEL